MDRIKSANGSDSKMVTFDKNTLLTDYRNEGKSGLTGIDIGGKCYHLFIENKFSTGTISLDMKDFELDASTEKINLKDQRGEVAVSIHRLPKTRGTFDDLVAYLGFGVKKPNDGGYTPPEGAVDVSLLNLSDKGKESLSKHEGGCILHVYNDYKGAKSDFGKEHFNKGKVIEDHKDNAKWISDKCESQNHFAEIKRLSIKGYGNPTIGVGYMISNHSELEKYCIEKENKITKEECLELFSEKLPDYIDDLKNAIPNGSKLTQCQFDALVSIVYNRGIGKENCMAGPGKCGFKSDEFYKKIILGKKFNASEAYDLILNDHSKLKGGDRRKAEAELYTNCKY
jgi:GH24 family phage-related lysozyme (muramidase)